MQDEELFVACGESLYKRENHTHAGEQAWRLDFDTTRGNSRGEANRKSRTGPDPSAGKEYQAGWGSPFDTARTNRPSSETGSEDGAFRIPAGSRKAALVHLALEAWRARLLDPKALGEVRGREVDEVGLQRALYRSSMGEIEHLLGPVVKGRRVIVEGRLAGTGRTALERLGAEVEELRLEDQKRYIDMTPAIFVFAAVAMAVRYISLGLDDQDLYILAGILFALMYGLRPFFFKMQRPRDE
jgi:hypothetical protein